MKNWAGRATSQDPTPLKTVRVDLFASVSGSCCLLDGMNLSLLIALKRRTPDLLFVYWKTCCRKGSLTLADRSGVRAIAFGVTYVYESARSLCDCGGQNFAMDRKDMRILRAVSVEVERYRTFMACACGRLRRVHSQAEVERYIIVKAYACANGEVIKEFGMGEERGCATVTKGEVGRR